MLRSALALALLPACALCGVLQSSSFECVFVTDAHGWYSGHRHNETEDADYGSLTSFIDARRARASPVFAFENGDLVDGGGLADVRSPDGNARGTQLFSILQDVGFNARTLGNHELYSAAAVSSLNYSASFVTSNVVDSTMLRPLGARFKRLALADDNAHVLVLGFLYEMKDHIPQVQVQRIADICRSLWFVHAVAAKDVSAVVVLAHMGARNALIVELLKAIRGLRGAQFPVLFVAGHTHVRARVQLDACAWAIEAGRFSDTVGLVQISPPCQFQSELINATRQALFRASGSDKDTTRGLAVRQRINQARQALLLDRVVGYSSVTRWLGKSHLDPLSLMHFYLSQVVPMAVLNRECQCPGVFITNTGVLRYDMLRGPQTLDDLWAISPFVDELRVGRCVSTRVILAALERLQRLQAPERRTGGSVSEANYVWTAVDGAEEFMDVVVDEFDAPLVFGLIAREQPQSPPQQPELFRKGLNGHEAFVRFYKEQQWMDGGSHVS